MQNEDKKIHKVGRTENSIKNGMFGAIGQIIIILLSFASRTVFIRVFNADYVGVSSLFSNILTVLSLAELGVGTAMTFAVYGPFAERDYNKISAYFYLYRKAYNIIGIVVWCVGILLTPALSIIIKNPPEIKENIYVIYNLVLANTAVSYFFAYNRSIFIADQRSRVDKANEIIFEFIKNVSQITILVITHNYYLYLCAAIVVTLISNVVITIKARKEYPEIRISRDNQITKTEKYTLKKNILSMMSHKLGSVVVSGTDNIIISAFLGATSVGLYANYQLVSKYISNIIYSLINGTTASFGNLIASEDNERVYKTYRQLYYLTYCFALIATCGFFSCMDSFVSVWIGNQYHIPKAVQILISIELFFVITRRPNQILIDTYGLFWKIRYKSLIEAAINLSTSIVFVSCFHLGLFGVILGTVISDITTNIWWEPFVAYKYGLKRNVLHYYISYFFDAISVAIVSLFVWIITRNFGFNPVMKLVAVAIVSIASSVIYIIIRSLFDKSMKQTMAHLLDVVKIKTKK